MSAHRRAARAAAAVAGVLLAASACVDRVVAPAFTYPQANGGTWATWVLTNGSALRPPPPPAPGSAETQRELDEIVALQRARTAEDAAQIRRWNRHPTTAWHEIAIERLGFYWPLLPDVRTATPPRAARAMALLDVAIHDAMVAAWDAKYAYGRRAPSAVDPRVTPLAPHRDVPSYPSEHAAAATAAAAILAYVFPADDTAHFTALAREAGASRVVAGAAYPSDVTAGAAIGRAVAERVIARAQTDGSQRVWSDSVPSGAYMWKPTPPRRVAVPFDPLAGTWRPWVIPAGNAYRPPPHPSPGSPAWAADFQELRRLSDGARTPAQANLARYWATDAPSVRWHLILEEEIARRGVPALHAARMNALLSVAMYDAFVACWDAKYAYWLARPVTVDTTLTTVFSTPPFPSYPSGHSTISTAASTVLADLFPDAAERLHALALEASLSRVWGGVHYRFDIVAGEALGERVGHAVVERAAHDGAMLR